MISGLNADRAGPIREDIKSGQIGLTECEKEGRARERRERGKVGGGEEGGGFYYFGCVEIFAHNKFTGPPV